MRIVGYVLLVAACGGSEPAFDAPPEAATGPSITATIGVAGGTVALPGGASIIVPPEALDGPHEITISEATAHGATAYVFTPQNLLFARPATIVLPSADASRDVYWTTDVNFAGEHLASRVTERGTETEVVRLGVGGLGPKEGPHALWISSFGTYINPNGTITNHPISAAPTIDGIPASDLGDGTWVGTSSGTSEVASSAGAPLHLITDASAVDFGRVLSGRPDREPNSSQPISLTIDGLGPWAAGDHVEVSAPAVSATWFDAASPADGATDVTASLPASENSPWKPDGSRGDELVVLQLEHVTTNNVGYTALTRAASVIVPAAGQAASTSLVPVARDQQIDIAIDSTAWHEAEGWDGSRALLLNPGAYGSGGPQATVIGLPGIADRGDYADSVDLAQISAGPNQARLEYALPPGAWNAQIDVRQTFPVKITTMFGVRTLEAGLYQSQSTTDTDLTPHIGPVLSPTLDGISLFEGQTMSHHDHELAWQPPATGAASYVVIVWALDTSSVPLISATWMTDQTHVALPAASFGFINAIEIRASARDHRAPSRAVPRDAESAVVGGLLTFN